MRVSCILLMALIPISVNAEWLGGFGIYNISDEEGSLDISLSALTGSIGYRFKSENNFWFMPELRVGIGVGDDTLLGADVELDRVLVLAVRGQYDFDSGMYLFGAPSYANLKVKASSGGFSASDDSWEFGVGGGAGYNFSDTIMGEISYETYDGADVFGLALKFAF